MSKIVKPYGSWKSPISANLIAYDTITLLQTAFDGDYIYWREHIPANDNGYRIARKAIRGPIEYVVSKGFDVRTRAHEYGGGAYVVNNGTVYFCNDIDQRIYKKESDSEPKAITLTNNICYADYVVDQLHNRLISVQEDHNNKNGEPINSLVAISLDGTGTTTLVLGNDFYSNPRISPDGNWLCWLTWNHPNMPWDGTELWIARFLPNGSLSDWKLVAGGNEESIFQPEWSPEGVLYFVSDHSKWWNLYSFESNEVRAVCPMQAEFGVPQWKFGFSLYGFASSSKIVCALRDIEGWKLGKIETGTGELMPFDLPYTDFAFVKARGNRVVFRGGSPTEGHVLAEFNIDTNELEIIRRSSNQNIGSQCLSVPETFRFSSDNGKQAYGLYYPPRNNDFVAPESEKPPLIVRSHGGPTDAFSSTLDLYIQFWTSRGFAVFAVNYSGSTGYGREYRNRLRGKWGKLDVHDCISGARYLVQNGKADPERLIIGGRSAGGYTTLCALTFETIFKAGASYYGICDLEALAKSIHKFESHYLDKLIGKYPEERQNYLKRSPINHVRKLSCPIIFMQGLQDKIVPADQTTMMVEALLRKGLPVAYLPFKEEQHGFRHASTIKRALEAELYFYSQIFGFELAEPIESVEIQNLKSSRRSSQLRM